MIRGVVNARFEAVIKLRLRGPAGGDAAEAITPRLAIW